MQYLKPNVCKQLEAMGLVSESEMYYILVNHGDYYELSEYPIVADFVEDGNIVAFTISDILLNADNARKLWGEEMVNYLGYSEKEDLVWQQESHDHAVGKMQIGSPARLFLRSPFEPKQMRWIYKNHQLLDLHLSGTDIEPELQKAIESKPL